MANTRTELAAPEEIRDLRSAIEWMEKEGDMAGTDKENGSMGREMHGLMKQLYPICRSITGNGVRETLNIIQKQLPLTIEEVPTGTRVFDWTVPKEWNIEGAFIKNSRGEKIVDFADSNLHVVSYSVPFRGRMSFAELQKHLFTLPEHPDWTPYRTSYYKETWGFCLPHRRLLEMADEEYEVCINSSLVDGYLSYGEHYLPGATTDEILLTCHICHPSLCNDNLSGISLMVWLAKHLGRCSRRYSYRFLFIPGTIGAITWLARNEARVSSVKHGFVIAGVADAGSFTYKKSRRGNADVDRAFSHILKQAADESKIVDFDPYGYDERQFCSPGFNLPIGRVSRTPHGQYPQYHTSADNLDFISLEALKDSFDKCASVLDVLESNKYYVNQNPKCELQLGKRGLYRSVGGQPKSPLHETALLWVLNLSDGMHSLLDIAERSALPFEIVQKAAGTLVENRLLTEIHSCDPKQQLRSM